MKPNLSKLLCLFCFTFALGAQADMSECSNALLPSDLSRAIEKFQATQDELISLDKKIQNTLDIINENTLGKPPYKSETIQSNITDKAYKMPMYNLKRLWKQRVKIYKKLVRQIKREKERIISTMELDQGDKEVYRNTIARIESSKLKLEQGLLESEMILMQAKRTNQLLDVGPAKYIQSAGLIIRQIYNLPNREEIRRLFYTDLPYHIKEKKTLMESTKQKRTEMIEFAKQQDPEFDEKNNTLALELEVEILELEKEILYSTKYHMKMDALLNFESGITYNDNVY